MKPGDNIEESVRKLRHTTSAETDERILSDALAALQESTQSRPVVIKSTIAALIAAVIIIAVFIGFEASTIPPQKQPQSLTQAPAPEAAIETVKEPEQDLVVKPEPEPATEKPEAELKEIERLFTAGDIDGLASMLSKKPLASQLTAAVYLAKIGDLRALEALEKLSSVLGGDEPNNPFSITAASIRGRIEQEKEKPALAGADKLKSKSASQVVIDEEKYIDGWLIDANGDPTQGEIQLGGLKIKTETDGAFTIREPNDTEFGSVFGRALDVNGGLGCFFMWDKDDGINEVEIVVEPLAAVRGYVVDDADAVNDFELKVSVSDYQDEIGVEPWKSRISPDGSFEVNSIPVGVPLQLAIEKPGFDKVLIKLADLVGGKTLDVGEVRLKPLPDFNESDRWNCSLAGLVTDENNEPLADARINLTADGKKFEAATDINGWYEVRGLPNDVQMDVNVYFDGYGGNLFDYNGSEPNGRLDIQIFPLAYE